VTAAETTNIIIVFEVIQTDGASVSRGSGHLRRCGSTNGVIFVIRLVVMDGRGNSLGLFQGNLVIIGDGSSRRGSGNGSGMVMLSHFKSGQGGLRVFGEVREVVMPDAGSTTRGGTDTAGSGQTVGFARGSPDLVLCEWEALVDVVHGHEFLLSTASMRTGHGHEIDGIAILSESALAVALIVAETILDADNDPEAVGQQRSAPGRTRHAWLP